MKRAPGKRLRKRRWRTIVFVSSLPAATLLCQPQQAHYLGLRASEGQVALTLREVYGLTIAGGIALTESALRSRRFGAYTLQAAIAAVHAETAAAASTDWRQIMLLYDRLIRIQPSPVVELNRAVAIAMCEGPEQWLCLIDDLLAHEELAKYHLAHAARADLCRRRPTTTG